MAAFINALYDEGSKADCLDQVVRLWDENLKLRKALEPFADFIGTGQEKLIPSDDFIITNGSGFARRQLTIGDCRKARAVLEPPATERVEEAFVRATEVTPPVEELQRSLAYKDRLIKEAASLAIWQEAELSHLRAALEMPSPDERVEGERLLDELRQAAEQFHSRYRAAAAELSRLRAALEPFAEKMAWPLCGVEHLPDDTPIHCEGVVPGPNGGTPFSTFALTLSDFRRARAALEPSA